MTAVSKAWLSHSQSQVYPTPSWPQLAQRFSQIFSLTLNRYDVHIHPRITVIHTWFRKWYYSCSIVLFLLRCVHKYQELKSLKKKKKHETQISNPIWAWKLQRMWLEKSWLILGGNWMMPSVGLSGLPLSNMCLTLPMLQGYFRPKHKDAKIFVNHLKPVLLVFIRKLSLSTIRWVPIC